jgi:hypothetical protein
MARSLPDPEVAAANRSNRSVIVPKPADALFAAMRPTLLVN